MENNNLKTRIAPTPSGFLHIGNGAAFVATWALARACNGQILLRIDDLDAERMRPEYIEDIFRTLDWLGLDWDEGAFSVEDFFKNWSQHLRLDVYEKALKDLQKTGDLYACNCSRKEIRMNSTNGLYPNTCRKNRLDTTFDTSKYEKNTAWRIVVEADKTVNFKNWGMKLPEPVGNETVGEVSNLADGGYDGYGGHVNLSQTMGDFIVRQKNGLPAYQLASLVDDTLYNINFIVRGADLLPSTAAQIFLAEKLNQARFLDNTFWHHPLMTDVKGVKLSKSEGATSLLAFREMGNSAKTVVQQAAKWLGFMDFEGETALELVDFIKK